MVLERVADFFLWRGTIFHIFLLSVFFSLIGIATSALLFSTQVGLIAVFFTSLALILVVDRILSLEKFLYKQEIFVKRKGAISLTELRVSPRRFNPINIFRVNKEMLTAYLPLFLGVFLVFSVLHLFSPTFFNLGFDSLLNFVDSSGSASNLNLKDFFGIFSHNLIILFICFAFALVYGSGTVFIISLNAAVWGVVFAQRAIHAAEVSPNDPLMVFLLILLAVLPHTLLEAGSYFSSAIGGGIISRGLSKKAIRKQGLKAIVLDGLILLVFSIMVLAVAGLLEVTLAPFVWSVLVG